MSSSASRGPIPQPSEPIGNGLLIKIMSPSPDVPPNLSYVMEPTSTVDDLKLKIQASLEARPARDQQKLIYRGKVLDGGAQLGPIVIGNAEREPSYTLHLVLKPAQNAPTTSSASAATNHATNGPSATNPQPSQPPLNPFAAPGLTPTSPITRTTMTASYQSGPSTVTTTTTRIAASFSAGPGANPLAQLAGLVPPLVAAGTTSQGQPTGPQPGQSNIPLPPELADRINEQIRNLLQGRSGDAGASSGVSSGDLASNLQARRSATNTARASEEALPTQLRIPRIVLRPQAPTSVSSSSAPPVGGPSSQPLPRGLDDILSQGSNSNRSSADLADRRRRALQSSLQDMEAENRSQAFLSELQTPLSNHLYQPQSGGEPVLYMLRDPYGRPHSLILPPNTHPSFSPAAIPTPSNRPTALNPAPYPVPYAPAGLTSPMGTSNIPPLDVNANITAPLIQQLDALTRNLEALTARVREAELRAAAGNNGAGLNGMNVQQLGERVRERAGHLWLAMKLAVFVFLFAGQGGWSRMLYLGSIAVLIFIWQTGMVRPLLDALNPPPPQGRPRVALGPNQPGQPNQANQQPNAATGPANTDPIDPARTAQIIIERHEGAPRRMFRALENGVGLFIASLVPGLHERHVEAAERRDQELRRAREGTQQPERAQPTGDGEQAPTQLPGQAERPVDDQHQQDQDQLRRRNIRTGVEDVRDDARPMGLGGPVGVGF